MLGEGQAFGKRKGLTVVLVELSLIISGMHGLSATSRVQEGVLGQEADRTPRKVMLLRAVLVRLAIGTENALR